MDLKVTVPPKYIGLYWDNGRENGNCYLGFRVKGLGLRV